MTIFFKCYQKILTFLISIKQKSVPEGHMCSNDQHLKQFVLPFLFHYIFSSSFELVWLSRLFPN